MEKALELVGAAMKADQPTIPDFSERPDLRVPELI